VLDGDLTMQIGTNRFRLDTGDAVRIPRGTRFGRTRSERGAQLLLIRTKIPRSFTLVR
jgi:mannose-6-phosphate isomerase-like protein (cupin superfamily)